MSAMEMFERLQNVTNKKLRASRSRCFNDQLDDIDDLMMAPEDYQKLKSAISHDRKGAKKIERWEDTSEGKRFYAKELRQADKAVIDAISAVKNPSSTLLEALHLDIDQFREMQRGLKDKR